MSNRSKFAYLVSRKFENLINNGGSNNYMLVVKKLFMLHVKQPAKLSFVYIKIYVKGLKENN